MASERRGTSVPPAPSRGGGRCGTESQIGRLRRYFEDRSIRARSPQAQWPATLAGAPIGCRSAGRPPGRAGLVEAVRINSGASHNFLSLMSLRRRTGSTNSTDAVGNPRERHSGPGISVPQDPKPESPADRRALKVCCWRPLWDGVAAAEPPVWRREPRPPARSPRQQGLTCGGARRPRRTRSRSRRGGRGCH